MFSQINVAQFNFEELTDKILSDYLVCLTVFILWNPLLLLAQKYMKNMREWVHQREQKRPGKPPCEGRAHTSEKGFLYSSEHESAAQVEQ